MNGNRENVYIDPSTEFWAHSSNLQVWYENNYDTRLLHRNLAFPLLKALSEAGDLIAKRVFKEEIAIRLASGCDSVVQFLVNEHYVDLLDRDQYFMSILNPLEAEALLDLEDFTGEPIKQIIDPEWFDTDVEVKGGQQFTVKNNSVSALLLYWWDKPAKNLPESILNLKNLEILLYRGDNISSLPKNISKLKNLKRLVIYSEILEGLPVSISKISNLEFLSVRSNKLKCIPKNIGDLKNLRRLSIGNGLEIIPDSITKLQKLEYLNLYHNHLTSLPVLYSFINLKELHLDSNELKDFPNSISKLENLDLLSLNKNELIQIPESVLKLKNLRTLFVEKEKLTEEIFKKLKEKGVYIA